MKKTIEISNMEILSDLAPSLNELKTVKMRGQLTLRIVKTMNNIFDALKRYDNIRKQLIEKYAVKDEGGKFKMETVNGQLTYIFEDEESKKAAGDAVTEIANEKINLEIHSISEEEISSLDNISADVIGNLIKWKMIDIDEQNKADVLKREIEKAIN